MGRGLLLPGGVAMQIDFGSGGVGRPLGGGRGYTNRISKGEGLVAFLVGVAMQIDLR